MLHLKELAKPLMMLVGFQDGVPTPSLNNCDMALGVNHIQEFVVCQAYHVVTNWEWSSSLVEMSMSMLCVGPRAA